MKSHRRAAQLTALGASAVVWAAACGSSDDETRSKAAGGAGGHAGTGGVGGFSTGGAGATNDGGPEATPDSSPDVDGATATGGASGGAGDDASDDAAPDGSDAAAEAPVSQFCGDGIRDPVTEECDDGNGVTPPDSCSSDCRVQDVLVLPGPGSDGGLPPTQLRHLGEGRHPVAASSTGFAIAITDTSASPYSIKLRLFDEKGTPGATVVVTADTSVLADSNPVIASLPSGQYAVVYTDLNGDGFGRGVAMRLVDPTLGTVGPVLRVNSVSFSTQQDPDAIWTGSELVVAFADNSNVANFADIKLHEFDSAGAPIGPEQTLAGTTATEAILALAPFASGWAAAWRSSTIPGESVVVHTSTGEWTTEQFPFGPTGDRPALAELDSTHLLLVYTTGGSSTIKARLRGMIVDTSSAAQPTSFSIDPLVLPYSTDPSLGQMQANLVRVEGHSFIAWKSDPVLGTPEAQELWLKQVTWSENSQTLDLSLPEIQLPRAVGDRKGNQSRPALAPTSLFPDGAIASAWEDSGRVFGSIEGVPDVVAELIPVPVVRLPDEGGLQ